MLQRYSDFAKLGKFAKLRQAPISVAIDFDNPDHVRAVINHYINNGVDSLSEVAKSVGMVDETLRLFLTGKTKRPGTKSWAALRRYARPREQGAPYGKGAEFDVSSLVSDCERLLRSLEAAVETQRAILTGLKNGIGNAAGADPAIPPKDQMATEPTLREKGDALLTARQAQGAAGKRKAPPRTG